MKNLTKLLLGLGLLLASSVTAQAQNVFNHPSVIDPSNITLFSGITLSQMSAGVFQNYIIQNPWKYNNITISLTATTSSHSLQIIVLCSPDANASDATISNNNSGVVTMTMSSSAGVVGFTPSIANGINMAIGAGIPTKVSVPITGCAVIDIQLFQAVGAPLTDTFSGKALLNDFSMIPTANGIPMSLSLSQNSSSGLPVPITMNNLGNNVIGQSFSGVDNAANTGGGLINCNNVQAACFLQVWPDFFNGQSAVWDRQFYCSKTTFVSAVTATTTQIVAGVGGLRIRVCSIVIERNDVAAVATTIKLVEGTGANCAAGQTSVTANLFTSGATAVTTDSPPAVLGFTNTGALTTNVASDALCVQTTGAASSFDVTIAFDQH